MTCELPYLIMWLIRIAFLVIGAWLLIEIWVLSPVLNEDMKSDNSDGEEIDDSKLPLQLAIVGKPNVGKSTLLNAILQENRVLVGPEAGLTRDSIRVQFEYEGRNVYLVSVISFI